MALRLCEEYLSNYAVLILLLSFCNHGNLALKLYQKTATLMNSGFS